MREGLSRPSGRYREGAALPISERRRGKVLRFVVWATGRPDWWGYALSTWPHPQFEGCKLTTLRSRLMARYPNNPVSMKLVTVMPRRFQGGRGP